MIKKSVFEQELMTGMQHQLRKQASTETPDLVKAGECLHAAMEILEEAGLQAKADQVFNILRKIAGDAPVKAPTLQEIMRMGLTKSDLEAFKRGEHGAKTKFNAILRVMGYGEPEIARFIGKHNVVPEHEVKSYIKFMGWMKNPDMPVENDPTIPKEISMTSLPQLPEDDEGSIPPPPGESFKMRSIAGRPSKKPDTTHPGLPHNGHTKNLTPQKMIENLKHHGTVFNMADDGLDIDNANFDPELAEALEATNADDMVDFELDDDFSSTPEEDTLSDLHHPELEIEDFGGPHHVHEEPSLDFNNVDEITLQDITDADDDELQADQIPLDDFEDEVSNSK